MIPHLDFSNNFSRWILTSNLLVNNVIQAQILKMIYFLKMQQYEIFAKTTHWDENLHTLLVKHFNDLLDGQKSERSIDKVTYFYVRDLFCTLHYPIALHARVFFWTKKIHPTCSYQIPTRDFLCNAQKVLCNNRHAYFLEFSTL